MTEDFINEQPTTFGEPWEHIWHGNEVYPFPLSVNADSGGTWIARDGTTSRPEYGHRIVSCVNALAGRDPFKLAALEAEVEKSERAFRFCLDTRKQEGSAVTHQRVNALRARLAAFRGEA